MGQILINRSVGDRLPFLDQGGVLIPERSLVAEIWADFYFTEKREENKNIYIEKNKKITFRFPYF